MVAMDCSSGGLAVFTDSEVVQDLRVSIVHGQMARWLDSDACPVSASQTLKLFTADRQTYTVSVLLITTKHNNNFTMVLMIKSVTQIHTVIAAS
jgi:hypothetical protein